MPKTKVYDKAFLFIKVIENHFPELLPSMQREFKFHGVRRWRFDFAWPELLLAVEVDGHAFHVKGGGRHAQDKDKIKLNTAAAMGYCVLRFSPSMITDTQEDVVEMFAAALEMCRARHNASK